MGVSGLKNTRASSHVVPDPGRHVHPRRFRGPRYAEAAEIRRKQRRRARRRK